LKYIIRPSVRNLRNLCDHPLDIIATIKIDLVVDLLFGTSFRIDLYVISNAILEADIILGREFLHKQKLTLVYKPGDHPSLSETNLCAVLALYIREDSTSDLEAIINNCEIEMLKIN